MVISLAFALLARNKNVRQEMHFDFDNSVALTFFASASGDVERESASLITPFFSVVGRGEKFPDIGERARVSGGVRPRRPTYRRLVDCDDLIEILYTLDFVAIAVTNLRAVEFVGRYRQQDFVYERTLAAARNARDRRE